MINSISMLTALTGSGAEPESPAIGRGSLIPFQTFLDQAVQKLNEVSVTELNANELVQQFTDGKASLEDAVFAMNELTTMVQFANQIVTTAVTTFREIEQMQI